MWWPARTASRRRVLAAGLAAAGIAALGGCGFQPVYGRRAPVAAQLNEVAIALIPDRSGQRLRNLLIDRFYIRGRPAEPAYRLDIALAAVEERLGIQKDATATRAQLWMTAAYRLIDQVGDRIVLETQSRALVSYNLLTDPYATLVSRQDAFERGLVQLADDITSRLSLYFTRGT